MINIISITIIFKSFPEKSHINNPAKTNVDIKMALCNELLSDVICNSFLEINANPKFHLISHLHNSSCVSGIILI